MTTTTRRAFLRGATLMTAALALPTAHAAAIFPAPGTIARRFDEADLTTEQIQLAAMTAMYAAQLFDAAQVDRLLDRQPEEIEWDEASAALLAASRNRLRPVAELTDAQRYAGLVVAIAYVHQTPPDLLAAAAHHVEPLRARWFGEAA